MLLELLKQRLIANDAEHTALTNYIELLKFLDWMNPIKIENNTDGMGAWWVVKIGDIEIKNIDFFEAIKEAQKLTEKASQKHL